MKSPFEVLGIADSTKESDIVRELEERLVELEGYAEEIEKAFQTSFRKGVIFSGSTTLWDRESIEEDLAEQFACGIEPTSKYMGYDALDYIINKSRADQSEGKLDRTGFRYLTNIVGAQSQKLFKEISKYRKVLDKFKKDPKSDEARAALQDLYIRKKYEDSVVALGADTSKKTPVTPKPISNKSAFMKNLADDPRYMELNIAYQQIATDKARTDLVPELYVKSRLGDPKLLAVANPEWKDRIIKRERMHSQKFADQQADRFRPSSMKKYGNEPMAENQNHDYSWAIILTKPSYVMKGIPVNNSDFSGRITVKHLGSFSAESLFRKRKLLKSKFEKVRRCQDVVEVNGKVLRLQLEEHLPDPSIPENMREYYYRQQATKELHNNIYLVSKTDTKGVKTDSLVFSPNGPDEFRTEIPQDFAANVYFSNYALNIARQNGGFAGTIIDTPKGFSISTAYNQDDIASSVLFQNKTMGRMIDRTAKYPVWEDVSSDEAEVALLATGLERIRGKDE